MYFDFFQRLLKDNAGIILSDWFFREGSTNPLKRPNNELISLTSIFFDTKASLCLFLCNLRAPLLSKNH